MEAEDELTCTGLPEGSGRGSVLRTPSAPTGAAAHRFPHPAAAPPSGPPQVPAGGRLPPREQLPRDPLGSAPLLPLLSSRSSASGKRRGGCDCAVRAVGPQPSPSKVTVMGCGRRDVAASSGCCCGVGTAPHLTDPAGGLKTLLACLGSEYRGCCRGPWDGGRSEPLWGGRGLPRRWRDDRCVPRGSV